MTLAIVVALNHYGKGLFKLASILIRAFVWICARALLWNGMIFSSFKRGMVSDPETDGVWYEI